MRFLVYGAGAIGTYFAFRFSLGHEVVMVSRGDHAEVVKKEGLLVKDVDGTQCGAQLTALTSLTDLGKEWVPDIILITVKSYDTAEAVDDIMFHFEGLCREPMALVLAQNGLDNEGKAIEVISGYHTPIYLYRMLTTHGAIYISPGEIMHTGHGKTIMGFYKALNNAPEEGLKEKTLKYAINITAAGIKTKVSEDIRQDIWKKGIVNAAINPLTALLGVKNGALMDYEGLKRACARIIDEAHGVAKASGGFASDLISQDEMMELVLEVIETTKDNRSSMLQDLDRGRRTEIDSISGAIVDRAKSNGIEAPLNSLLHGLIKYLELKKAKVK